MPKRPCQGTTRRGQPCKVAALTGSNYCRAHDPQLPAESRFGSPQQAREAATGVERRYPRLREQVAAQIEANAERIVGAQIEALNATRLVVGEDGSAHVHPDFLTRLRAGDTLLSRALGKPGQELNVHAEHQSLVVNVDASDPETRDLIAGALRRRPVAVRHSLPG